MKSTWSNLLTRSVHVSIASGYCCLRGSLPVQWSSHRGGLGGNRNHFRRCERAPLVHTDRASLCASRISSGSIGVHSGADWPFDVQGICAVGRSVLGPLSATTSVHNCGLSPPLISPSDRASLLRIYYFYIIILFSIVIIFVNITVAIAGILSAIAILSAIFNKNNNANKKQ